jgi:hypothetical protein
MDSGWAPTMDEISNEELFSAVLSSKVLVPYLERDPDLAELIKFPNHPNVYYFKTPAPAKQLLPALKQRLGFMISKNISQNLEATKQLVAFMDKHPDSQIYDVTFNCPTQHYGVRLGLTKNQLHGICVMTGGHISDELLGGSVK